MQDVRVHPVNRLRSHFLINYTINSHKMKFKQELGYCITNQAFKARATFRNLFTHIETEPIWLYSISVAVLIDKFRSKQSENCEN